MLTIVLTWSGCMNEKVQRVGNVPKQDVDTSHDRREFDEMLSGLNKSYILAADASGKEEILRFYNKLPEQYTHDSIEYRAAVQKFYNTDKMLVDYLLGFEKDTSLVFWVGQYNPLSSRIEYYDLIKNQKRIAAMVLIYNYLADLKNRIQDNYMVKLPDRQAADVHIDYNAMRNWYNRYRNLSVDELRKQFQKTPPPPIELR